MPIAISFADYSSKQMCLSWDTCCAQHGQEHLFPCLPHLVQLRPILGLLLKASDLHGIGLAYVPRKLGGSPRVGTCGTILAESARGAPRLLWAQPLLALLPRSHKLAFNQR